MTGYGRKVTVKAEVWFEVVIDAFEENETSAASILNADLLAQAENMDMYVLPHIIDWIVSEPKDEEN